MGYAEGRAAENPCCPNKRSEKSRDRVLSDAELCVIWRPLGNDDTAHHSIMIRRPAGERERLSAKLIRRGVIHCPVRASEQPGIKSRSQKP
jgi:hypothetical protein